MVKRILSTTVMPLVLIFASCSEEPLEEVTRETVILPTENTPPIKIDEPELSSNQVFNWVAQMQGVNGLLESSEQMDFVSLYDNALASIWYTSQGKLKESQKILDFFNSRLDIEFSPNDGGFFQYRNSDGQNGSRKWMGDNAWLLIAIKHYHEVAENGRYAEMAVEIEEWLRSLQDEDGGVWGGFNEDGTQIPKVTEGMITAFNAVDGFDDFHKGILNFIVTERWHQNDKVLLARAENTEYDKALDLYSLGYLILADFPETILGKAEVFHNTQEFTVNGAQISGYCFDQDKDVVWLEGTAQMAVAFQTAGFQEEADQLMYELEKTFINSASLNKSRGIPYATNIGTSYGNSLLWEHADLTPALSSTIWYLFAKEGFNPLHLGRGKTIPSEDKFW